MDNGASINEYGDVQESSSADLPSEIDVATAREIGVSAVAVFAASEGQPLKFGGSGTLVAVADSHYILTAAHVWERVLKDSQEIAITLKDES